MKKLKALNCPFCGSKPIVRPYPNHRGASVECSSDECALWGFKADLDDWNNNRIFNKYILAKYLFDVQTVYKGSDFYKTQEYTCRCCRASNEKLSKVRHKRGCEVKKLLGAAD